MLIDVNRWIKETFEKGSRPSKSEVFNWIESGVINGKIITETKGYVDADLFALAGSVHTPTDPTSPSGGSGKSKKGQISGLDLLS